MSNREEFEIWAKKEKLSISYGDCGYVFSSTEMAWRSWQTVTKKTESQLTALTSQLESVVAENAGLKNALEWLYETVSSESVSIPDEKYSSVTNAAQVLSETPATDSFLAEVRASAISEYADKRGFSFQHGSIHAHFGNGDVLVGATKFETGHAGICFAPVRDKTGGSGTEYAWTEGKNTEEVGAVFVISSSSVEGLEVIQGKIAEAIAQLRQGAAL